MFPNHFMFYLMIPLVFSIGFYAGVTLNGVLQDFLNRKLMELIHSELPESAKGQFLAAIHKVHENAQK